MAGRNREQTVKMNQSSKSLQGEEVAVPRSVPAHGSKPWLIGLVWILVCMFLYRGPLRALLQLASHNDDESHILLIPFISLWLLYLDRAEFGRLSFDLLPAFFFLLPGSCLALLANYSSRLDPSERLSSSALSFLFFLGAGYVAIFGRTILRKNWFPLAFLLFAVPLPEHLLNRLIYVLQAGSAAVAEVLFDVSGVPVLREGFIFRLPRMSIEVAKECSGIRSSTALLVLAVLVAHFSFRPLWKKVAFVTAGLLMMLLKNGVRIVTLTLLANYVDPDFLFGRLHHQGGVVFFVFGLALLAPVYWLLRRTEHRQKSAKENTIALVDNS
jgi:exosortase